MNTNFFLSKIQGRRKHLHQVKRLFSIKKGVRHVLFGILFKNMNLNERRECQKCYIVVKKFPRKFNVSSFFHGGERVSMKYLYENLSNVKFGGADI